MTEKIDQRPEMSEYPRYEDGTYTTAHHDFSGGIGELVVATFSMHTSGPKWGLRWMERINDRFESRTQGMMGGMGGMTGPGRSSGGV